jgi:hypothetical protein
MSKMDFYATVFVSAMVLIALRCDSPTEKLASENPTIEWAPFRLAPGVDEAAFLKASSELQTEFVSKQRGFIKRELLKGKDNQWVDIIYWRSREEAEQAGKNAMNSAICQKYFSLMASFDQNDPNAGVFHFEQVKAYQ